MTHFLILLAIALPANAEEPVNTLSFPAGSTVTVAPDGTKTISPPVANRELADAALVDSLVASTEAKRAATARYEAETVAIGANTPALAYNAKQVNKEGNDLFGGSLSYSTQVDDCIAVATSQSRKAKLEVITAAVARCREIAVEQTRADTAREVALYAISLDRPLTAHADGSISVTEHPATALAWRGNGGVGNAGMAFGQSPFNQLQTNAVGWQAVMAGQQGLGGNAETKPEPKGEPTSSTPQPQLTPEQAEAAALEAERQAVLRETSR